nr:MAG TPA: Terminase [Caudoviricetes sp.]
MALYDDNIGIFKQYVKEYGSALQIPEVYNDDESNKGFYSFMHSFYEWLYYQIHTFLTPNKNIPKYESVIKTYCNYIRDKILPICNNKIKHYNTKLVSQENAQPNRDCLKKWLDLEDNFYALACYRNLEMMALYLERGKTNKLWAKTIHLFRNFYFYSQKLVFEQKIDMIRASYFPGAGKTYAVNILCAWWWGYDNEASIIRVTYSADLCKQFIQQITDILDSPQYRKVFPKFDIGNVGDGKTSGLYNNYSVEIGFRFAFSSVQNFYATTRDGQTTGKRGNILIIDDITKGSDEAYDENLHKRLTNKFDTEWNSRGDSSYQPIIAVGTMWSNLDLLNVLHNRAIKNTNNNMEEDSSFKYTELSKNNDGSLNSVFISTPILDYATNQSTCPLRYSTEKMLQKRDNMDEALWNAVYQQRPTPPEEFLFAISKLQTYDDSTYPKKEMLENETQCYAFIDPTRKGTDFFSMPIFKRYRIDKNRWSKWYWIDIIFEQKATKELMFDIAFKIINHRITKVGYENNIDVSFDSALKYTLRDLNYSGSVTIEPFYSSNESKQMKISNAAFGMKKEIIYPAPKMFAMNSPMGKAMNQLTMWSLSQRYGDHDDCPDSISMFVKYYCEEQRTNTMEVFNKSILGF